MYAKKTSKMPIEIRNRGYIFVKRMYGPKIQSLMKKIIKR